MLEQKTMSEQKTLCTFHVDHLFLGIDVCHVQEVRRSQRMTRVPLANDVVAGLINLRGQIVTALEMRKQLDLPQSESDAKPMNVLVRVGENLVSLLVDRIGDVIDVNDDQFEPAPETLPENLRTAIKGIYKLPGQLLLLLDTDQLRVESELSKSPAWSG